MPPPRTSCRPLRAHTSLERSNRQVGTSAPTVQRAQPSLRIPHCAPRRHGNQGGADPPNPARPRPSRSPAQHGDRQPGSGAADARRALGAAGRWPGLTRWSRPASVCRPRPSSLPHRFRTAASAPLAQACATLGGGAEARPHGRAEGARPRGRRRFVSAGSEEEPGRAGRRPGYRGAGPGTAATRGVGLRAEARTARR